MTIKEAMNRANRVETGADLLPRLSHVLDQLHDNCNLDASARSDIMSIIDDGLELAASMLNTSYPAELVLRRMTNILSTAQRILIHTETSRPGRYGFGVIGPSGDLLPILASTQDEAMSQLSAFVSVGLSSDCTVIPIRMSSTFVLQPQTEPLHEPIPEDEPITPEVKEFDTQIADALGRAEENRGKPDVPTFGTMRNAQ